MQIFAALDSGIRSAALLSAIVFSAGWLLAQAPSEINRIAQQAESDLHNQEFALAASKYQQILAIDPDNVGAHSNLGLAHYLQNEFGPAASEFEIALRLKPDLWNIEALCGLSEAKSGKFADAITNLKQAFPHVAEPSLREAVGKQLFSILLDENKLNEAADVVDQLQQLDGTNIDIQYAAHQVHSLLADRAFMAMAQHDPDSARMYQLRGDRMAQIGNMEGAIAAYRLAIARDPHLSGAHFSLGEALSISRNEAERAGAEAEYKTALADNPMDEKAECRLGDIEMQRSNVQSADAHYRRALQLEPDDPDANEGYGIVLLNQDSVHDARTYLSRAIQLDPGNVSAHYHLSQASRKAGDMDAAKREMDEFLKLKAQRENLKHSFNDLPLQSFRQTAQEQNQKTQPETASKSTTSMKDNSK